MIRVIIFTVVSLLASATAFAQQPQQQAQPDPAWLQQVINSLQTQRNKALDDAAIAQSQFSVAQSAIGILQQRNADLQKQLDDQKKQVADLKSKYEPSSEPPKDQPPAEEKKEP